MTPSLSSWGTPYVSDDKQELAERPTAGCTGGCTRSAKLQSATFFDTLAEAVRNLTPSDRARLVEMLISTTEVDQPGDAAG